MTPPSRRGLWLAFALLVAAGLYVVSSFRVTTDITHFLPRDADRRDGELMREITASELSRTMVLLLEADDPQRVVAASHAFEAALRNDVTVAPALAFLEGGPPTDIDQAVWELYQPRRWAFVADDPQGVTAKLSSDGLREALDDLTRRLSLPLSPLLTKVAPQDPLLTIPRLYERLEGSRADGIAVAGDRFVTEDGLGAVLFLGTHAAAFDSEVQGPLLAAIDERFVEVARAHPGVTLRKTGVNRHAVAAEAAIKRDITRVSTASVMLVVLLFSVLFRSPRFVAAATLPIGAGMVAGMAACLAAFGQIHSLTLAFGAGLIGVAIDYAIHLFCHHCLDPQRRGPWAALGRTWTGIALGAATTITGFVALGLTSFPGLQEVAVFASVGIFAALACTKTVLPHLVPASPVATTALRGLTETLSRHFAALRRTSTRPAILLGSTAIVLAIGLPRATWDDDIRSLQSPAEALVAEDDAVYSRVVRFEQRRFALAIGPTDEAALAVNDRIDAALRAAQAAGELAGYRNVGGLLPSAAKQHAVTRAVMDTPDLWPRLQAALTEQGFRPEMFEPFRQALTEPVPPPLTYGDLIASPLAPLVRSFRIELDDRVAFLTFLSAVEDPQALAARLDAIDGARLLDQGALMRQAYEGYRNRIAELLVLGLAAVLLVLGLRYRSVRSTAAAIVPALLAGLVTIASLGLLGVPMSVLTLTALLMVLSIGVDYGVFLVESVHADDDLGPTLTSLLVACASTVFGFGLLALSDHPALHGLGLTACVGVFASFVLAPTSLVLIRTPRRTP